MMNMKVLTRVRIFTFSSKIYRNGYRKSLRFKRIYIFYLFIDFSRNKATSMDNAVLEAISDVYVDPRKYPYIYQWKQFISSHSHVQRKQYVAHVFFNRCLQKPYKAYDE